MIRIKYLIIAMLFLSGGCAVRINQIETARRLMPGQSMASQLEAYAWLLTFNGVQIIVYPVQAQGRNVIFANGNGLRLTWDGETVIVIDGFPGAMGRYESGVEGPERWYARAGSSVVRSSCSPKREWRLTADRMGWRQECSVSESDRGIKTQHLVEVDRRGQIRLIEATLVPGAAPLRLQKQK